MTAELKLPQPSGVLMPQISPYHSPGIEACIADLKNEDTHPE
jgi:hypothetical protein